MLNQLNEARAAVAARCPEFPKILICLGSGFGSLMAEVSVELEISYSEIPHMKTSTVAGHAGKLTVGVLHGQRVAVMQGRLHFYEGNSMAQVVFPFRVFGMCGAETFLLTNACGGLNPIFRPGELMLIRDHINMVGPSPLIGPNLAELGPRFPDMTCVYDARLRARFHEIAGALGIRLHEGVYLGVSGPAYETPAEIKFFRTTGADAIGMSTVPEATALRHMGKTVAGISCVTNQAAGDTGELLSHDEVLENGKKAAARFSALLRGWLAST